MTSRDFVGYGLIIIVLVVLLWFANDSFIRPGLAPQLPEPDRLPPAETFQPPVNKNIVATTLERIRDMFPGKESVAGFEPRRVGRNPFLWPEEMLGAQYAESMKKEGEEEERGVARLGMIIIGENRKVALINDKLVFEGMTFDGDTVYAIKEKEVILRGDTGETRLMLAEFAFEPEREAVMLPPEPVATTPAQTQTIEGLFEKLKPLLQLGP